MENVHNVTLSTLFLPLLPILLNQNNESIVEIGQHLKFSIDTNKNQFNTVLMLHFWHKVKGEHGTFFQRKLGFC